MPLKKISVDAPKLRLDRNILGMGIHRGCLTRAEMNAKHMRAYGALSDADTEAIDSVIHELEMELARIESDLAQGPDAHLSIPWKT